MKSRGLRCCECDLYYDRFAGRTEIATPEKPYTVGSGWALAPAHGDYPGRVRWVWGYARQWGVPGSPEVLGWHLRTRFYAGGGLLPIDDTRATLTMNRRLGAVPGDLLHLRGLLAGGWQRTALVTAIDETDEGDLVLSLSLPTGTWSGLTGRPVRAAVRPWRPGYLIASGVGDEQTATIVVDPGHGHAAGDLVLLEDASWASGPSDARFFLVAEVGDDWVLIGEDEERGLKYSGVPAAGPVVIGAVEGPYFEKDTGGYLDDLHGAWPAAFGPEGMPTPPPIDGEAEGQVAIADGEPYTVARAGSGAEPLLLDLPEGWDSYKIVFRVRGQALQIDDQVTLYLDYQDAQNHLAIEYWASGLGQVVRVAGGARTPLNHLRPPLWYVDLTETFPPLYSLILRLWPAEHGDHAGQWVLETDGTYPSMTAQGGGYIDLTTPRIGIGTGPVDDALHLVDWSIDRLADDDHPDCETPPSCAQVVDFVVPVEVDLEVTGWESRAVPPTPCCEDLDQTHILGTVYQVGSCYAGQLLEVNACGAWWWVLCWIDAEFAWLQFRKITTVGFEATTITLRKAITVPIECFSGGNFDGFEWDLGDLHGGNDWLIFRNEAGAELARCGLAAGFRAKLTIPESIAELPV